MYPEDTQKQTHRNSIYNTKLRRKTKNNTYGESRTFGMDESKHRKQTRTKLSLMEMNSMQVKSRSNIWLQRLMGHVVPWVQTSLKSIDVTRNTWVFMDSNNCLCLYVSLGYSYVVTQYNLLPANSHDGFGVKKKKSSQKINLTLSDKYSEGSVLMWNIFSSKDPGNLIRIHGNTWYFWQMVA